MDPPSSADGNSQEARAEDHMNVGNRRRPLLAPASVHFPGERRRSRSREHEELPRETVRDSQLDKDDGDEDMNTKQKDIQAIKSLVEKELENLVSPEISKHIKKVTLELSNKIYALQRTKKRLVKAGEEVKLLKDNRLPSGVRGVPIPFETPLLDSMSIQEDVSFNLQIPAGKTFREAKSMVHMAATLAQKELDQKIVSFQRDELRKVTKKDAFVAKGLQAFQKQAHNWAVLDLDLEDDELEVRGISEVNLTAKLHAIYKKTVDKIAADVKKHADMEDKSRKTRADLISQLTKTPPAELLNKAIDDRIAASARSRKPMQKRQQDVDNAALFVAATDNSMDVDAVSKSLPSNSPLPKNGLSPAKGGGNTEAAKGKGKGKGGDTAASQKGKGKSKAGLSLKGKGKGKTKTKTGNQQNAKGRGKAKGGEQRSWKGQGRGNDYRPAKGASKNRRSYQ